MLKFAIPPTRNIKFASPNAKPQRKSLKYRLHWVPNANFLRWSCTFHVFCVDFICVWWPTQTQFPVEYGLKTLNATVFVGYTNMLVSKNVKICITPNAKPKICVPSDAKPTRKSVEYRLRWVPNANLPRWACTFHIFCVDFICVVQPISSGIWA